MEDSGGCLPDHLGGHQKDHLDEVEQDSKAHGGLERLLGGHSTHAGILPASFVDVACFTHSHLYSMKNGANNIGTQLGISQRTRQSQRGAEPCYSFNVNESPPTTHQHTYSPTRTNLVGCTTSTETVQLINGSNYVFKESGAGFISKVPISQQFQQTSYLAASDPSTIAATFPLKLTQPNSPMPYSSTGGSIPLLSTSYQGPTSRLPPVLPVREMQHCSRSCRVHRGHAITHEPQYFNMVTKNTCARHRTSRRRGGTGLCHEWILPCVDAFFTAVARVCKCEGDIVPHAEIPLTQWIERREDNFDAVCIKCGELVNTRNPLPGTYYLFEEKTSRGRTASAKHEREVVSSGYRIDLPKFEKDSKPEMMQERIRLKELDPAARAAYAGKRRSAAVGYPTDSDGFVVLPSFTVVDGKKAF